MMDEDQVYGIIQRWVSQTISYHCSETLAEAIILMITYHTHAVKCDIQARGTFHVRSQSEQLVPQSALYLMSYSSFIKMTRRIINLTY